MEARCSTVTIPQLNGPVERPGEMAQWDALLHGRQGPLTLLSRIKNMPAK
jgi:hypothetical protein